MFTLVLRFPARTLRWKDRPGPGEHGQLTVVVLACMSTASLVCVGLYGYLHTVSGDAYDGRSDVQSMNSQMHRHDMVQSRSMLHEVSARQPSCARAACSSLLSKTHKFLSLYRGGKEPWSCKREGERERGALGVSWAIRAVSVHALFPALVRLLCVAKASRSPLRLRNLPKLTEPRRSSRCLTLCSKRPCAPVHPVSQKRETSSGPRPDHAAVRRDALLCTVTRTCASQCLFIHIGGR